jgi:glycosyltransferase involved in cell wall biosynthesis
MRLQPAVIGHGIDPEAWKPGKPEGYILWNKNRGDVDVCDPTPIWELANRGLSVVTTFNAFGKPLLKNMKLTGAIPHHEMKEVIRGASVYLATAKETFGIGILEAMAAGVPVLGYSHGGVVDIVRQGVDGYLAPPGDIDALMYGYEYIKKHWRDLSAMARRRVLENYTWEAIMPLYVDFYRSILDRQAAENQRVAVIIPNHNYAHYIKAAVESVLNQIYPPDEIIIVDDGSTDNSPEMLEELYGANPRIRIIAQTNQGVSAARNNGISAASSDFIVCLDADDKLAPQFIQVLRQALMDDRGLGIGYTGLQLFNDAGGISPTHWPPEFNWEQQCTPNVPPINCIPSACMFRRDMWERSGGYNQAYAPGEDAELWTRGLSIGFRAAKVTQEPFFHYRWHEDSASRQRKYVATDTWHPWMKDLQYPMGAPATNPPLVRSYSDPAVSVIIPVGPYHENYLSSALDSLLGQTARNWEVIAILDTDGDVSNLKRIYPFVKWIRMDPDKRHGAGAARNAGLAVARAPLVLFLDADDYLMPTALAEMGEAYSGAEGRYIYTDWLAIRDGEMSRYDVPEYDPLAWFERGQHAITVLMARKDALDINGFDETMNGWEDWDFFVKCAVAGIHGKRLPEALLVYRMDTGTRRETSLENAHELLGELRKRYNPYWKGTKEMSQCCGGNADALLKAKAIIARANSSYIDLSASNNGGSIMAGKVRLEFVGEGAGSVTYRGKDGRTYKGGNNTMHRYIDAHPEDAPTLLATGKWRQVRSVQAEAPPPTMPVAPAAPARPPAPPMNPVAALEQAKREAAELEDTETWTKPKEQELEPVKAKTLAELEKPVFDPETEDEETPALPSTVKEILSMVGGLAYNQLMAWRELESKGKDRVTALEAIDAEIEKRYGEEA